MIDGLVAQLEAIQKNSEERIEGQVRIVVGFENMRGNFREALDSAMNEVWVIGTRQSPARRKQARSSSFQGIVISPNLGTAKTSAYLPRLGLSRCNSFKKDDRGLSPAISYVRPDNQFPSSTRNFVIGSGGWMSGRCETPFEPPFEELPARSQGFSPGYEPSAPYALRVKPGYPTPLWFDCLRVCLGKSSLNKAVSPQLEKMVESKTA